MPEAGHAVGVHLDRDELRVVLVDLDGAVVGERCEELDLGAGAEAVLGAVCGAVRGVAERLGRGTGAAEGGSGVAEGGAGTGSGALAGVGSLVGVGVALPGPLDHAHGVLHRVTGFPEWDGFPLRDALAERLGVPVVVDKDTNAAALGLAAGGEEGAAGGSFAYLHLGTGLGAGLVIGGTVHRGARTGAGEFGHQVIQLDGPLCECGNRGCVEVLCLGAVARGTWPRRRGCWGWRPGIWWGCWTSTWCCSGADRRRGARGVRAGRGGGAGGAGSAGGRAWGCGAGTGRSREGAGGGRGRRPAAVGAVVRAGVG